MARARGANIVVAGAIAATYGAIPASGFRRYPVVSIGLGEEQGLIASDTLGNGRDPQEAGDDVVNNEGPLVAPVDLRNFGFWLRLLMGDPVTSAGIAATGSVTFTALPVNLSTLTVNGTVVTFVTAAPAAGQVQIGATVAATVEALVAFLNASADTAIDDATYSTNLAGTAVEIVHDTLGTAGNSFTLAKGTTPAPNATLSGATLTGGAATGAYNHVFTAGQLVHPDAAIEVGMPDVPHYGMNYGVMANTLSIQAQRSGLLNANIDLIAQGEATAASAMSGTLATDYVLERFSQFTGVIEVGGVPVGKVQSATLRMDNGLDKDESIRPDGRIAGADPAGLTVGLDLVVRFADRTLFDLATNKTPVRLRMGWQISALKRLDFVMDRVRLPRVKVPVDGPNGIRATFPCQATEDPTTGRTLRAVLVNDVVSY